MLLLLRFLPHGSLLELLPVCVILYYPLAMFVLFELTLLIELGKKVFRLESFLRLSLLELKSLLKLSILLLKLICSLCFAQFLFLQLFELGSSASTL